MKIYLIKIEGDGEDYGEDTYAFSSEEKAQSWLDRTRDEDDDQMDDPCIREVDVDVD